MIDLSKAHELIEKGKERHKNFPGLSSIEYYIEYRYLGGIVAEVERSQKELEQARAEIEELRRQLKFDRESVTVYRNQNIELSKKLAKWKDQ